MCQDCIKFLTDAQAEAKTNTSFIDSLIENIEGQCDLLGPGLSAMVREPHMSGGGLIKYLQKMLFIFIL